MYRHPVALAGIASLVALLPFPALGADTTAKDAPETPPAAAEISAPEAGAAPSADTGAPDTDTTVAPTVVVEAPAPWTPDRPDGHGPSGVMADHLHRRGEAMIGYRAMWMAMAGMREGAEPRTKSELFARGYQMLPAAMTMQMHMFGAMLGLTRRLTLTAMVPVKVLDMTMETASGETKTQHTSGLGDLSATALVGVARWRGTGVHLGLGALFPTGSTNLRDDSGSPLPYPMQLGSGTFGLTPSLTWVGQRGAWSWGTQVRGTLRVGTNDQGYRLGQRFGLDLWGARRLLAWASVSARLQARATGGISGSDTRLPAMAPKMMPTADASATGGATLDAWLGLNLWVPSGLFARHRLALEVGLPLYQNLNGPQMSRSWSLALAWQYTH